MVIVGYRQVLFSSFSVCFVVILNVWGVDIHEYSFIDFKPTKFDCKLSMGQQPTIESLKATIH
jgi:hypothetical protein